MSAYSSTVREMVDYLEPVLAHVSDLALERLATQPGACDFRFGNPQEMPLPAIERAITKWAAPQDKDWFAYTFSDPRATKVAVDSLRRRVGIDFDQPDVAMTTGAFGALATTLRAVLDPGDEVIYLSPPWFFYVPMILSCGARAVRVDFEPPRFELPVDAIAAAITDKTRAVIVNTPHNPSGRVLTPDELERLSRVLAAAPRPPYLISDESYCRILFDGRAHDSPLRFYNRSFLIYTYGKTLLAPGQRIGYIAMPPSMPDRKQLRSAILVAQCALGWTFPNAVMQYAMGDLEQASIDVPAMQRRRDRVVTALTEMGYETVTPEGAFYVVVRSPIADDLAYMHRLAEENVFVLPGRMFELPGWFRISLTANDEMVERSLAGFARAISASRVGNLP
ncbi:MAG TPA: aminotransferase class I/II-fold pyridoxal phosphate-dependent enzyme [Candidatus Dormibacteraeota bacterium]|nr:aminotransferase class I/II-fold pyridoxal phosphate-dependent enzyme [Candidatus Dormibacteraeota bacterium]